MRVADGVVLDGAQPEALCGVVGRLFQPAVVEAEGLALAIFQKQLAIVGTLQASQQFAADFVAIKIGTIDQGGGSWAGHAGSNSTGRCLRRGTVFADFEL
jgi:hypothetical protein